ncbi:MAG: TRAP transporter large permease subunit, partial [Pseudomonadales bacterium]|nr:TRAP transporter large permease subunit [Pseudomonadales bacterium]
LIVGILKRQLSWKALARSLSQSTQLSANIFLFFIGGVLFSRFLVLTGITPEIISLLSDSSLPPWSIMLGLVLLYLLLGAILDTFGMIIITLPLVFPIVTGLGYDPVWFGIFLVLMIEMALITPPIGINVFVLRKVVPNIPIWTIYEGCLPYIGLCLIMVLILIAFPELALWLPSTMKD